MTAMAFNDKAPPVPGDQDVLSHVLRMVIPMRREHNRSLEVRQFMHDVAYAKEIIEQAIASKDLRLQEYGAYLSNKMFGPRNTALPQTLPSALPTALPNVLPNALPNALPSTLPSQAAASAQPAASSAHSPAEEESEAAMRARMMAKYKTGLR
jgi:hypothetical protein